MKLSIIVPSLHPSSLARAIGNIEETTVSDYEIVVISPFEPSGKRVKWVQETTPLCGPCAAQAYGGRRAAGDYIVALSDDRILSHGWDQVAIGDFDKVSERRPFVLSLRHHDPGYTGTVFGITYPNFPMMRRKDVSVLGWYDPMYITGWGDVDLGLRVWAAGGMCQWSSSPVMASHPDDEKNGRRVDWNDMDRFLARWKPKYGMGWRTDYLGYFNFDVYPDKLKSIVRNRSIFHNDPSFIDMLHGAINLRAAPPATVADIHLNREVTRIPDPKTRWQRLVAGFSRPKKEPDYFTLNSDHLFMK